MNTCPNCQRRYASDVGICPVDGTDLLGLEKTVARDRLIGATLGHYVVRSRIGQGGMGVVYRGEQPSIGKKVAIKILAPDLASDPESLQRLAEEARVVSAIRHRGIIEVFDFGTTPEGLHYLVMELLEGEPFDVYLARKRLTAAEAVQYLDEILCAAGAAHKAGVIHRDLKPGNIFLERESDGGRYVKLLDFGLAKRAARSQGSAAQTNFRPSGTPVYMSPEQARGERVGPYTDLYAIGVIAFEMLTGEPPFIAPTALEILFKHVNEPAPSLVSRRPSVPLELEALVLELLQKDPKARPAAAEIVRNRLKPIAHSLAELRTMEVAVFTERELPAGPADAAPTPRLADDEIARDREGPLAPSARTTDPWLRPGGRRRAAVAIAVAAAVVLGVAAFVLQHSYSASGPGSGQEATKEPVAAAVTPPRPEPAPLPAPPEPAPASPPVVLAPEPAAVPPNRAAIVAPAPAAAHPHVAAKPVAAPVAAARAPDGDKPSKKNLMERIARFRSDLGPDADRTRSMEQKILRDAEANVEAGRLKEAAEYLEAYESEYVQHKHP